jgi:hypothetical protein
MYSFVPLQAIVTQPTVSEMISDPSPTVCSKPDGGDWLQVRARCRILQKQTEMVLPRLIIISSSFFSLASVVSDSRCKNSTRVVEYALYSTT